MTPESSLSLPGPSASTAPPRAKRFQFDQRYIAPLLVTSVLIAGQYSMGVLESYVNTAAAILAAILTELILGRLVTKRWPHLASAYVSGISVGILIRSQEVWPYVLCSAIAITSKYVIRYKGRHLWNPSNLGIVAMLLLAYNSVATLSVQFDNRFWAMIAVWVLGSFIIARLKRFHICLTYALSFVAFAALRAALGDGHIPFVNRFLTEVAPITGPMYQLFIFFMITDPKTTVHSRRGQMLVAFLVAAMECVLRLMGNIHAPYYALFLVGPLANFIEIQRGERRKTPPSAVPATA